MNARTVIPDLNLANLDQNQNESTLINDKAIFDKTFMFRDKDWNVVYGEEDLHKMFVKMARKNGTD